MLSSRPWLIPSLVILSLAPTLPGCVFANIDLNQGRKPYKETLVRSGGDAKVALIDVAGTITDEAPRPFLFGSASESMMARILDQLSIAAADDSVVAVVLKIDSPGGSVTASDIIYRELLEFRRRTGKKVVASLGDTAASGGYYVAVATDCIVAHPTTVTGSIGVIMQSFNLEGLLGKIGVEVSPIKSAEKKDIGSPFRKMSDAERKVLQGIIDDFYGRFVACVRAGRPGLSATRVRELADGRVYTGTQAKASGLVDELGYTEDAIERAAKLAGASGPRVVRYHRENEPANGIHAGHAGASPAALVEIDILNLLGPLRPGFYYYWAPGLGNTGR